MSYKGVVKWYAPLFREVTEERLTDSSNYDVTSKFLWVIFELESENGDINLCSLRHCMKAEGEKFTESLDLDEPQVELSKIERYLKPGTEIEIEGKITWLDIFDVEKITLANKEEEKSNLTFLKIAKIAGGLVAVYLLVVTHASIWFWLGALILYGLFEVYISDNEKVWRWKIVHNSPFLSNEFDGFYSYLTYLSSVNLRIKKGHDFFDTDRILFYHSLQKKDIISRLYGLLKYGYRRAEIRVSPEDLFQIGDEFPSYTKHATSDLEKINLALKDILAELAITNISGKTLSDSFEQLIQHVKNDSKLTMALIDKSLDFYFNSPYLKSVHKDKENNRTIHYQIHWNVGRYCVFVNKDINHEDYWLIPELKRDDLSNFISTASKDWAWVICLRTDDLTIGDLADLPKNFNVVILENKDYISDDECFGDTPELTSFIPDLFLTDGHWKRTPRVKVQEGFSDKLKKLVGIKTKDHPVCPSCHTALKYTDHTCTNCNFSLKSPKADMVDEEVQNESNAIWEHFLKLFPGEKDKKESCDQTNDFFTRHETQFFNKFSNLSPELHPYLKSSFSLAIKWGYRLWFAEKTRQNKKWGSLKQFVPQDLEKQWTKIALASQKNLPGSFSKPMYLCLNRVGIHTVDIIKMSKLELPPADVLESLEFHLVIIAMYGHQIAQAESFFRMSEKEQAIAKNEELSRIWKKFIELFRAKGTEGSIELYASQEAQQVLLSQPIESFLTYIQAREELLKLSDNFKAYLKHSFELSVIAGYKLWVAETITKHGKFDKRAVADPDRFKKAWLEVNNHYAQHMATVDKGTISITVEKGILWCIGALIDSLATTFAEASPELTVLPYPTLEDISFKLNEQMCIGYLTGRVESDFFQKNAALKSK